MNPTLGASFLLGLWLVVGGVIATLLCVVVGWRNGFHFRSKEVTIIHRDGSRSTEQIDSTLKWMLVVAICFMGPQAFLLGSGVISDLLYEVTATLARFWWVPLLLAVLALTVYLVWRFVGAERRNMRQDAQNAVLPHQQPVLVQPAPPVYGSVPYGQHGDGGLGSRPKG